MVMGHRPVPGLEFSLPQHRRHPNKPPPSHSECSRTNPKTPPHHSCSQKTPLAQNTSTNRIQSHIHGRRPGAEFGGTTKIFRGPISGKISIFRVKISDDLFLVIDLVLRIFPFFSHI